MDAFSGREILCRESYHSFVLLVMRKIDQDTCDFSRPDLSGAPFSCGQIRVRSDAIRDRMSKPKFPR
jgi:hypothetical protein